MKQQLFFLGFLILISACSKNRFNDRPDNFADDFESYASQEELMPNDNSLWSFYQLTYDSNSVVLDSNQSHSGKYSIRCFGVNTEDGIVSKASICKNKMAFQEGTVFVMDAWYYLEGNQNLEWLFIFDLEENTQIGAGPGMRLVLVENQLRVEHKYLNPDILQPETTAIDFPRNQWVNVCFEVKLSQRKKGYVKVWQNDQLIIEQDEWQTLPKDILYFQQGTKGIYTNIEFGVTAAAQDNNAVLFVDDIQVFIKE
ncbi:MAG: heparin lyase I family protein [Bacteroidales bacterium]|nr:heparin lyase I family protein [Bacteroidales bacterium]